MEDCIFCKLAKGELSARTVYEDERFRAILDAAPISKGHVLILPKEHASGLDDLPLDLAQEVLPLAQQLTRHMRERLHCDGMNLLQNNGKAAGQTIPHFHLHLIPRYADDLKPIKFDPHEALAEELDEVLKQLTNGI